MALEFSSSCPECGAPQAACASRFDEFLSLEFTDPAYGAVHHLTVAAYMLQHSSRLTRDGWLEMRVLLHGFLVEGKPPALVRRENRRAVDSGQREFRIRSRTGEPVIPPVLWSKNICGVRFSDPATYCADVEAWARAVLEESQALPGQAIFSPCR